MERKGKRGGAQTISTARYFAQIMSIRDRRRDARSSSYSYMTTYTARNTHTAVKNELADE